MNNPTPAKSDTSAALGQKPAATNAATQTPPDRPITNAPKKPDQTMDGKEACGTKDASACSTDKSGKAA